MATMFTCPRSIAPVKVTEQLKSGVTVTLSAVHTNWSKLCARMQKCSTETRADVSRETLIFFFLFFFLYVFLLAFFLSFLVAFLPFILFSFAFCHSFFILFFLISILLPFILSFLSLICFFSCFPFFRPLILLVIPLIFPHWCLLRPQHLLQGAIISLNCFIFNVAVFYCLLIHFTG